MSMLVAEMCPGLTNDVLEKLNNKGITKVLDFVSYNPEKITAMCGLPYKKMLSIRRYLLAQYSSYPINGVDLYDETMRTLAILSTGSRDLDTLLGAGIYTGEVTEVCGMSGSGKTQFCYSLVANITSELEQNVIYIDTTGDFSPLRMQHIIKSKSTNPDTELILSRTKVYKCVDIESLRNIISEIRRDLQSNNNSFYTSLKAVIIDSITSVLSPTMFNSSFIEGLAVLQQTGRTLTSLAKDFAIAVATTNDMTTSQECDIISPDGQYKKPALGRCWAFVPSVRVLLMPLTEPSYLWCPANNHVEISATLIKSTRSESQNIKLLINEKGICNHLSC